MKILCTLFAVLFIISCGEKKTNNTTGSQHAPESTDKEEDISYIPVTAILQSQLKALDSLPVTILQVTTVNKKDDSAWLTAAAIKPQLSPFFSPMVDAKNMVPYFKESKFDDQSTAAITFTYDPTALLPDTFSLRHWDVYVDPDKNAIRRIYLVKSVKENNLPVTQQLTWQMDKWAKIVTIRNDKNSPAPVITETKWVWDLNE